MRPLALLLALLLPLAARATPAAIEIGSPTSPIGIDTPFSLEIRRTGTWDLAALEQKADEDYTGFGAWLDARLDGVRIGTLWMAFRISLDKDAPPEWRHPAGWQVTIPALGFGLHELTVSYVGDALNHPDPVTWNFALVAPAPILPSLVPSPRDPFPATIDPVLLPTGIVILSDPDVGNVQWRDIQSLLVTDPRSGQRSLDLSWLTRETLVSYAGDANFPGFNFSYAPPDIEPVPTPAAPLPLALLALALLRRRARAATLPPTRRGPPCRMPTSSISASTPAIR